jgi:bifunctional UDP-N-acetylglucosamine pyrophosphorylase/glucosamine-1-phosphate N-acetyltransferase
MQAVILAAGEGRKFFPYDLTRQKAAVPIGNTYLIRWTVTCLRRAGVKEFTVVVGYREERVRHALRGVEGVRYVRQAERNGTAPAVLAAVQTCESVDSPVLLIYGDVLIDEEGLAGFARLLVEEKPFAAAMLAPMPPSSQGQWIAGGFSNGRLTGISGHSRGGSHLMCGIYGLSREALTYVEANPGVVEQVPVGGMPPMEAELAQSFQMMVDDSREVLAVEHKGLFVDVDKPWHLLQANHQFAQYLCGRIEETKLAEKVRIDDGAEIHGKIAAGPNVHIGNRVVIRGNVVVGSGTSITNGAMVGANCIIGSDVKLRDYCLLSDATVVRSECIVGHGAEMGGVLLDGAYLYHYCEMAGVFGARFDAGAATVCGTLRFDDADTVHNVRGHREVPETGANVAYVGDYTRTGVNAILMPGVKVGAYSCVGPGVVLYKDLPHGTLVLVQQDLVERPWGPQRYGW